MLDYRNKLNKLSIDYVGSNNYLRDKFSLLDDSDKLQQLGYDGVIELMDDGIEGEIVAINPNQIKSATENNGDFSAGNDDIRFSVSNRTAEASDELSRLLAEIDALDDEINGGLDRTQGRTEDILANEDVWQARIKSKRLQKKLGNLLDQLIQTGRADDKLVRNYLGYLSGGGFYRAATDKDDAIMRIQNAIVRAGGKVTDSSNAWDDLNHSNSRAMYEIGKFGRDLMNPIVEVMKSCAEQISKALNAGTMPNVVLSYTEERVKNGVRISTPTQKQADSEKIMNLYLMAKDMVESEDKYKLQRGRLGFEQTVGIKVEDYIAMIEKVIGKDKLNALHDKVKRATDTILDMQVGYGLITEKKANKWD